VGGIETEAQKHLAGGRDKKLGGLGKIGGQAWDWEKTVSINLGEGKGNISSFRRE